MFHLGFSKIAFTGTNNQGLEFNMADTNNSTANVGPGGMSPQGFESYQPIEISKAKETKIKKKFTPKEMVDFIMAKSAKVNERISASTSRAADGVVDGLKYESATVDATPEQMVESIKAEKRNHKNFIRAGTK